MMKSRREFLKAGLALPLILNSCTAETTKPLKILILGGTSFLGLHQVAYAIGRGHSVSIFTRGKTKPSIHKDLFKSVEQLIGDRKNNLTALENRKWDVVIDNSGHDVEWTKSTAKLLKDNCELYLYTSSTGVFYPYLSSNYKETDKVLLNEPEVIENEEEKIEYWYGVMKANSELEAIKQFGEDRTIIVRPTYMIGPADKSDRFIHWPICLNKGGEVAVPGKETDLVQYIDVRDVAKWMIHLIENKKTGTFNAVGPKESQTMYSFIEEAQKAFEKPTSLIKIKDNSFLIEKNIFDLVPWIMPTGKNTGSAKINNEKGIANGLTYTPLIKTAKDTQAWWTSDAVIPKRREKVEAEVFQKQNLLLEFTKN